jgi:hypothetical protein
MSCINGLLKTVVPLLLFVGLLSGWLTLRPLR